MEEGSHRFPQDGGIGCCHYLDGRSEAEETLLPGLNVPRHGELCDLGCFHPWLLSSLSQWVHACDALELKPQEREQLDTFIDQLYKDIEAGW